MHKEKMNNSGNSIDIQYSIVIPVYNETESMPFLSKALIKVMDDLQESYEIIFVNDGLGRINMEHLKNCQDKGIIKIINLSCHKGQTFGLAAGFKEAKGKFVISMDGDLQDNPKYIPYFINKIHQGFDVVCGYRQKRKDRKTKIILAKAGNFLQKTILKTNLHDISCTYRIYKRECLEGLRLKRNGYHRYIPFILIRKGYNVTELQIEQDARLFGRSKYKSWKAILVVVSFFFLVSDVLMKKI